MVKLELFEEKEIDEELKGKTIQAAQIGFRTVVINLLMVLILILIG
jgi:hypothetical protein